MVSTGGELAKRRDRRLVGLNAARWVLGLVARMGRSVGSYIARAALGARTTAAAAAAVGLHRSVRVALNLQQPQIGAGLRRPRPLSRRAGIGLVHAYMCRACVCMSTLGTRVREPAAPVQEELEHHEEIFAHERRVGLLHRRHKLRVPD